MARGIVARRGRDVTFRQKSGHLVCNACGEKVKPGRAQAHSAGKHALRKSAAINVAGLKAIKPTEPKFQVSCPHCSKSAAYSSAGTKKCRICGLGFSVRADGKATAALKASFIDSFREVRCPYCLTWMPALEEGEKSCRVCGKLFWAEMERQA